jgi:feruloyl esterase
MHKRSTNVGTCPGMNPATFDALGSVQRWREQRIVPDQIIASYADRNKGYITRPVCPYPQVAIYKGSGDTSDAANFHCGIPNW